MTKPTATGLLRQEADLIEAGVALQTQGLQLLLVEMRALAAMMPATTGGETQTDAEVEDGFDNLPV